MAKETNEIKILFLGEPNSPNTKSWIEGLRKEGCIVFPASVRTNGENGWYPIGNSKLPPRLRVLSGVASLKKLIKQIKPDILIAYRITSYGYLAAKSGFHPLVLAAQNEQIVYLPNPTYLRKTFLKNCAKYAIKKANLIHSWGNNITKGLKAFGAKDEKILTLHRGIDVNKFNLKSRNKVFDCKKPIFISTRTLAPEYLIDKLIEDFANLLEKIPEANLIIAGTGTEEGKLKQLASDLQISENIQFKGRVSHNTLLDLLNESDFYISVIATEGISSSLIESIACGLCPIAVNMSASKILIKDKINGFLIPSPKEDLICKTMLNAVYSYGDIKENILTNAKNIIKNYDRRTNQKKFISKYKKLIENENSRIQ